MTYNNFTFGSIIPLIGGTTLAAEKVTGNRPEWIASYEAFKKNDSYLLEYYKDYNIPYYDLEVSYPKDKVDIIVGLPPCAGLSMANLHNRGTDNLTNDYMEKITELSVTQFRPKLVMFENAPNLYTKYGEPVVNKLNKIAQDNGYSISLVKTSTSNHGIPQKRPRSFMFIWKGNKVPIFNTIKKDTLPFHKYILDSPQTVNNSVNVGRTELSDDTLWRFVKRENPNFSHNQLVEYLSRYHTLNLYVEKSNNLSKAKEFAKTEKDDRLLRILEKIEYKRSLGKGYFDDSVHVSWNTTPSLMYKTLPKLVHPWLERYLTIDEALHMMGFPVNFSNKVSITPKDNNVICQNCPVTTAADWLEESIKSFLGEREWKKISPNEVYRHYNL